MRIFLNLVEAINVSVFASNMINMMAFYIFLSVIAMVLYVNVI